MVRHILSIALVLGLASAIQAQTPRDVKVTRVTGRWVKVQGTDQFYIQTADNKEVPFYTGTTTRYVIDRRPVQIADFKAGNEVTVVYVNEGERSVVRQVYSGPDPDEKPATFYEGKVMKVVGQDRVVLRTADDKEVTVYVQPKTEYTFNDKPGSFADLLPGATVHVDYDLREQKPIARSVRSIRERR